MPRKKLPHEAVWDITPEKLLFMIFDSADWAAIIMVMSLLEDYIEIVIAARFGPETSKTQYKEVFDGYGPLASFAAKLAVGGALGIITGDVRHDLQVMKQIRNAAAHSFTQISFDDEDVAAHCQQLRMARAIPEDLLARVDPIVREKWRALGFTSPRARFVTAFFTILTALGKELAEFAIGRKFLKALEPDLTRSVLKSHGIDLAQLDALEAWLKRSF